MQSLSKDMSRKPDEADNNALSDLVSFSSCWRKVEEAVRRHEEGGRGVCLHFLQFQVGRGLAAKTAPRSAPLTAKISEAAEKMTVERLSDPRHALPLVCETSINRDKYSSRCRDDKHTVGRSSPALRNQRTNPARLPRPDHRRTL